LSYSSSDTVVLVHASDYLTNHNKSLLVNVQFFNQIPVSPVYSKICQHCHWLDPSNLTQSENRCQMSFQNLHSKRILYCFFLNFFHTSLSMLLLCHVYHILSCSHYDLGQENHLPSLGDAMLISSAKF